MFEFKIEETKKEGLLGVITLEGLWVTHNVWNVVSKVVEQYGESIVFIGSLDAEVGGSIRIELSDALQYQEEFLRKLNNEVSWVLPIVFTRIKINLYNWKEKGALSTCIMIAEETGCHFEAGEWNKPFIFFPEDNITYNKVIDLVNAFELSVII